MKNLKTHLLRDSSPPSFCFIFLIQQSIRNGCQIKTFIMKKLIVPSNFFFAFVLAFLIFLLTLTLEGYSQTENNKVNIIGISIPIIWNNSEATYYRLGSPQYPKGNAVSYGININYSRLLYKGFYGKIGVGYFNQCFKIIRPFNYYDNPGQLLYSTQSYNYNNIQLFAGLGYTKKINKNIILNGCINYNYFSSFTQKYIVYKDNKIWQINKKSLSLGKMVNFDFGMERNVSKKISLGVNFIIPIYTRWNKDEIFINNYYSNDEQQIARNKFSAGFAVSCYYHL